MIAFSPVAMTVIDLLLIGGVAIVLFYTRRHGAFRAAEGVRPAASICVASGLVIVALIHVADLIGRHGLPLFVSETVQRQWMSQLHLNLWWVLTTVALLLLCAGFLTGVLSQKTAAKALEISDARYRSIVEGQRDLIVRWKPDGTCTWANEAFCSLLGCPLETAIGKDLFSLSANFLHTDLMTTVESLSVEETSRMSIREWVSATEAKRWLEWLDAGLFDENGSLIEVQSVGRDVTDRVRTTKALESSEARFRRFVENTSDWVWEIDSEGHSIYNNRQVETMLGYTPTELSGMHWRELVHPDDLDDMERLLGECTDNIRGWKKLVCRLRHRDGSYRYLEGTADPVLGEDNELLGFQGIDHDSTFETLMSRISSGLAARTTSELDDCIRSALKEIALCYGIERVSFWWFDGPYATCSHEWSINGLSAPISTVAIEDIAIGSKILRGGDLFKVRSLTELPQDGGEFQVLKSLGIKSSMALPLFEEKKLIGFAAFSTMSCEREWSSGVESDLRHLADKIAANYVQSRWTQHSIRSRRDLIQSEALAHMGSFSYYPYKKGAEFPSEWRADFSQEQCALFEIEPDEASHELFFSRVHEDDRDRITEVIERLMNGASDIELQYRIAKPSGRVLHLSNRTRADRDRDGQIVRIIGANLDITERVEREASLNSALSEIRELRDRLEEENVRLREAVRSIEEFEQIVGESDLLRANLDLAAKAAPMDVPVLIFGETGTGKELVAKAIHNLSLRKAKPLISLNCTALPADLVESELFGHERGAFTGAHASRQGRFELADGGTLFMDEIADLPFELQGKLLRVLQDGSFDRLGSARTRRANVRLIAASNRDLREAVKAGEFRADLYYRINTVQIELPPLRERREDIPLLAHHFVQKHSPRIGKTIEYISADALQYLQEQDWPGNVRELEHVIERALISSRDSVLTLEAEAKRKRRARHTASRRGEIVSTDLRSMERRHILHVLEETDWTISGNHGAAARLKLPPSTLRSKMKRLGIQRGA